MTFQHNIYYLYMLPSPRGRMPERQEGVYFYLFLCTFLVPTRKVRKETLRPELRSLINCICSTHTGKLATLKQYPFWCCFANIDCSLHYGLICNFLFSLLKLHKCSQGRLHTLITHFLYWRALLSKSLAPRTSFSEGKVRGYPQHPFGLATAGCSEQQPVFFSFGCVFFSLLC